MLIQLETATNTIKKVIESKALFYLLIINLTTFCSTKKVIHKEVINKKTCTLLENNFNISNLTSGKNDLSNIELKLFNENNFEYDILFHSVRSGDDKYDLVRYYKDEFGWNQIIISDNIKKTNKISIDKNTIDNLFKDFNQKSIMQNCGNCFDCKTETLLIKHNRLLFKYISYYYIFENLNEFDKKQVSEFENIYQFYIKGKFQ